MAAGAYSIQIRADPDGTVNVEILRLPERLPQGNSLRRTRRAAFAGPKWPWSKEKDEQEQKGLDEPPTR